MPEDSGRNAARGGLHQPWMYEVSVALRRLDQLLADDGPRQRAHHGDRIPLLAEESRPQRLPQQRPDRLARHAGRVHRRLQQPGAHPVREQVICDRELGAPLKEHAVAAGAREQSVCAPAGRQLGFELTVLELVQIEPRPRGAPQLQQLLEPHGCRVELALEELHVRLLRHHPHIPAFVLARSGREIVHTSDGRARRRAYEATQDDGRVQPAGQVMHDPPIARRPRVHARSGRAAQRCDRLGGALKRSTPGNIDWIPFERAVKRITAEADALARLDFGDFVQGSLPRL